MQDNIRIGWDYWIELMRGRFSLSRGFPTSMRVDGEDIKSYRVEVGQDDELEQWSPVVYKELVGNMGILIGEGSIDPPEIGAHEPELPSNMSAFHGNDGGGVDGTEDIL